MKNDIVIFRGPSIPLQEAKQNLDATYLPPAMQGDMYKAYLKYKPKAMGLIDGNFERIPSPWHKEILYLISQGIIVFGSSSMGALRAAELDVFGMIGVGKIYEKYTNDIIEDDDEVAILHAPKELDYNSISDAMVDIRLTLEKAEAEGILNPELKNKLESFYKDSFYKNRFYSEGTKFFKDQFPDQISNFEQWIGNNKIEQKKQDAISLLQEIKNYKDYSNPDFEFQNTVYWHNLKVTIDRDYETQNEEKAA